MGAKKKKNTRRKKQNPSPPPSRHEVFLSSMKEMNEDMSSSLWDLLEENGELDFQPDQSLESYEQYKTRKQAEIKTSLNAFSQRFSRGMDILISHHNKAKGLSSPKT